MSKTKKLVLCTLILFFIDFIIYGVYIEVKNSRYETQVKEIPTIEEYKEKKIEKQLSPNVVAWVKIDDTNINYPILQGEDNYEYLNKDCYDENNLIGSIFLDADNEKDFSDDYNLVYGHNFNNIMLGNLHMFKDEKYFNEHRDGKLVVNEKEYRLKSFAFLKIEGDDEQIFKAKEGNLNYIRNRALIFEEPVGDRFLALTTCINSETIDRWVLICEIVD